MCIQTRHGARREVQGNGSGGSEGGGGGGVGSRRVSLDAAAFEQRPPISATSLCPRRQPRPQHVPTLPRVPLLFRF
jgi:hypothetical protein